jgi:hypothetical protein
MRTVFVTQVPSTVTAQIPDNDITAGQSVTIQGVLTHDDGASTPGSTIDVTAYDPNGNTRNLTTTTEDDGSWQVTDTPPLAGFTGYTVAYQGDAPRYAAWRGSFTGYVQVHPIQPTVTLQTDRSTYDAGTTAALHVDLTDSSSRQVTVVATRDGASPVTIFSGAVPDGGLTLHPSVMANETFTATTPADDTHSAAQATVPVMARLLLQTLARNPLTWHGDTAVYPTGRSPLFGSHLLAPRRTDLELRFIVQRRTASGWHTIATSAPSPLSPTRWSGWRFTGPHRTSVGYRARTEFPGDSSNVASHSPWVHFRFSGS